MTYNHRIHHRHSIRLKEYNYSRDGVYFITICTHNREQLFGKIFDDNIIMSNAGIIAYNELVKTSQIRKNFQLNCFVVMPNHIHAIVIIDNSINTHTGAYNTPECNMSKYSILNKQNESMDINNTIQGVCNTPLPTTNDHKTSQRIQSPSNNLGSMVRGYKSTVTKKTTQLLNNPALKK